MSVTSKKHSILGMLPLFNELQSQGFNPELLIEKHDIELDTMSASTLLNIETELAIIRDALALVDDPLFGLNVGNQVTITSYGLFALLLLSAPNIKTVIDTSVQYQRLSLAFTELSAHYKERYVEIRASLPDVSLPLKHFIADRDFAGNAVFIREIQQSVEAFVMGCGMARPHPGEHQLNQYTRLLGVTPQFDQPYNWIRIPIQTLRLSSKHSNPLAFKLYKVQAQELMHTYFSDSGDIIAQINLLLDGCQSRYPKLADLAEQFRSSESTLRRQLARRNTSYRELLEKHRRNRALSLIEAESLSVNELAEKLGYADAMGFVKAFKKWTGETPKQYMLSRKRRL